MFLSRLRWYLAFLGIALAARAQAQPETDVTRRPNIVLILMDDLGYGDIGSYGVPDAKTPHIVEIRARWRA